MTNPTIDQTFHDAIVIGGGPVGLATAIALAEAGVGVALVAAQKPYPDNRTTALLGPTIDFLERLDVWRRCADNATPLRAMRLVDATERLIRAPEVRFDADEIGLEAFGYNIENRRLVAALEARAGEIANIARHDDEAAGVEIDADGVMVRTRDGATLRGRLIAGADGRQSICRATAGIDVDRRPLRQTALTFNIAHARPHRDTSTEFHTAGGPCVFVPLQGDRSSVVWVTTPNDAARLTALSDDALAMEAERTMQSILGRVTVEPGRHSFPLAIEQPRRFARNRVVLVGEAAHVLPPIGAQGLNLGLRDADDIARIVADAAARGEDIGGDAALARFDRERRGDIASRTLAIDLANRSLLSDFLPIQIARAAGLHLLSGVGPLRRLAMREGLSPSWRRPHASHADQNAPHADQNAR
ncbi:MAG: UbiH/UbiF family hydroxylase [Xanthobacteraceae bacterium]|nr:UbiH/UbiF family hydroxylase [Xanthobacteraceae bacterium]